MYQCCCVSNGMNIAVIYGTECLGNMSPWMYVDVRAGSGLYSTIGVRGRRRLLYVTQITVKEVNSMST